MDFVDYFATLGPSFLFRSPALVAWIVAVVIAALMLRRGGGRAERLLLIGSCLMLAQQLISPFTQVLSHWLMAGGMPVRSVASISNLVGIPVSMIGLAGIVCLVVAFWIRWKTHGQQSDKAQVSQTAAE